MADEITTLSSRIAYQNQWLLVREDIIRRADGSDGLYGVVERTPFVVVVALQDGAITLVEQYRYPVRRRIWELPMGTWEHAPDADLRMIAAAELREETGLVAGRMRFAGSLLQGPGYCSQEGHIFLATDLVQGDCAREVTEQGMVCRAVPLPELEAMLRDGGLVDGMSMAALGLLRFKGMV